MIIPGPITKDALRSMVPYVIEEALMGVFTVCPLPMNVLVALRDLAKSPSLSRAEDVRKLALQVIDELPYPESADDCDS